MAARAALGLPGDRPVALCLGALSPEKRIDVAIEALESLPEVQLVVVGGGPERARLEALGREILGTRIRFLGATDDPGTALAAADLLVLPSATEGQPAVAIEAGLTGIPVVASDVGGLSEIVLDGRSGVLVRPDDPAGLAEGIRQALGQRDQMGGVARQHCEARFDLGGIAGTWAELLQRLLTR